MKPLFFLSLLCLSACSALAIKQPIEASQLDTLGLEWCVRSSSEMNIVDKTRSSAENRHAFEQRINLALLDIQQRFTTSGPGGEALSRRQLDNCPPPAEHGTAPTRLLLSIELSGYGNIKAKWKKVLIGTGVAEAIFQGALVNSLTHNPWLAFGVAAEEMVQEYLTWNGVDWFLGETFAPVTLEAELYYQQRLIWRDSRFVTRNEDELEEADKGDKEKQLLASLHKAEAGLFAELQEYLQQEIIQAPRVHLHSSD